MLAVFITCSVPHVEISGIPETTSVIAGTSIYKYMSFRTMMMKLIALTLVLGSGYIVGREGPLVHISCCVANNLSKLPCFSRLLEKNTLRKQMLAIASGVGVTATFGTPVGY